MDATRVPVVVGVGQVVANRGRTVAGAREPLELVVDAARAAAADAGADVLAEVDTVLTVDVASWRYDDLPGLLAARLGTRPGHRFASGVGGQWPARLLDEAGARVAAGQTRAALVAGGEAQASVMAHDRAGVEPAWSREPGGRAVFDLADVGSRAMVDTGLLLPVRVYPLLESALSHALGQSPAEAAAWSAQLYADFSVVAADNPAAWVPEVRTPAEVGTVGPANRVVCEPYPLRVNALPHVDQAAAVLVTSLAVARELGVADRCAHLWGGAGAADEADLLRRADLSRSAALASALTRTLDAGGVGAAELDVLDVYSPFPVVPKLAVSALGLPRDTVPTVTGGHSSFGGPLNSYSLHAVVAAVARLRDGAHLALVHANGGFLTSQHAVLLADRAHPDGFVGDPEPVATSTGPAPRLVAPADGPVVVAAATVSHAKAGGPEQAFLVARTAAGDRVALQTTPGDVDSARALSQGWPDGPLRDVVGTTVELAVTDAGTRVRSAR
ncbi:acetyl-CoA acetyltransferase [Rhodococcus aerolatus]